MKRRKRTTVTGLKCSECQSTRITKDGFVWDRKGKHQRYKCQNCGLHTIYPKSAK